MERCQRPDDAPGGPPRFLADTMLGRLATWLRILGYDAEYFRDADTALLERAGEEGRIILTRDTGLFRGRSEGIRSPADRLPLHLLVQGDHISEQLRQVVQTFRLTPADPSKRRCPRCNVMVEPRTKAEVLGRVPDFVWSQQQAFWGCPRCGRTYWAGSHRRRMDEMIRAVIT
jgi:uncharacterized protein